MEYLCGAFVVFTWGYSLVYGVRWVIDYWRRGYPPE